MRSLLFALVLVSPLAAQDVTLAAPKAAGDLLAKLLPAFEARTQLKVETLTAEGDALADLGRAGKAEILIANAPAAAQKLLADGKASGLQKLMTAKSGDAYDIVLMRVGFERAKRGRAADKLSEWLRSPAGQAIIAESGQFVPKQAPQMCPTSR